MERQRQRERESWGNSIDKYPIVIQGQRSRMMEEQHDLEIKIDQISDTEQDFEDNGVDSSYLSIQNLNLLFPRHLLHAFKSVEHQMDSGLMFFARIKHFMKKFASLQRSYFEDLAKLVDAEKSELNSLGSQHPDKMRSNWETWISVLELFSEIGETHKTLGNEVEGVVDQVLIPFEKSASALIKTTVKRRKRIMKSLKSTRANVEKAQMKCKRSVEAIVDDDTDSTAAGTQSPASETPSKSNKSNSDSKRKQKSGLSMNSLMGKKLMDSLFASSKPVKKLEKAVHCAREYATAVDESNQFLRLMLANDFPMVLGNMQTIEESRISTISINIKKLSSVLMNAFKNLENIGSQVFNISSKTVDVHDEIFFFVQQHTKGQTIDPKSFDIFKPFEYEVDYSPAELERRLEVAIQGDRETENVKTRESLTTGYLFGARLQDFCSQDKEDLDSSTANRAVKFLRACFARLEELDGLSTRGIFRISANSTELLHLRLKLDQGDEDFEALKEINSPYTLADVSKRFLMELKDPLIPKSVYGDCISIASEGTGALREFRDGDTLPEEIANLIRDKVLSKIPKLNMDVLREVHSFLRRVCSSEHVDQTLMTEQNLAVVFSPALIRTEMNKEDIAKVLSRMRYEGEFLRLLISMREL